MTYSAVLAATQAVKDQVRIGLEKQAFVRAGATANASDQRERIVCDRIINGTMPTTWVDAVLIELDIAGQIASPTDAQIDTVITTGVASPAVASVWSFLIASRL